MIKNIISNISSNYYSFEVDGKKIYSNHSLEEGKFTNTINVSKVSKTTISAVIIIITTVSLVLLIC